VLLTILGGQGVENGRKLLGVELDCVQCQRPSSDCGPPWLEWTAPLPALGKAFRTIDNGSNDLVDLSILGRSGGVGGCESSCKSRCKTALEGTAADRRGAGAHGALDPAISSD
jgi:hypothetical protein